MPPVLPLMNNSLGSLMLELEEDELQISRLHIHFMLVSSHFFTCQKYISPQTDSALLSGFECLVIDFPDIIFVC